LRGAVIGDDVAAMDRSKRIGRLWPYLPTFRVVAELQHVTRASAVLGVTPSAVSRTISLLEDDLEQALFTRSGRRIALTEAGAELLAAVRSAMRVVDDGLLSMQDQLFVGPVRVAAVEPFVSCLAAGAFARLRKAHPGLVPMLTRAAEGEVARGVLTGLHDVAFVRHPPSATHLVVTAIASFPSAVYLPAAALVRGKATNADPLSGHACADVAAPALSTSPWPAGLPRRVGAVAADYDVALSLCQGGLATVLPIAMASALEANGTVRRLSSPKTRPITLCAVARETVASEGRAEALVAAARDEATSLGYL
jgi:DNA-binding transcriptional LysR family regulator